MYYQNDVWRRKRKMNEWRRRQRKTPSKRQYPVKEPPRWTQPPVPAPTEPEV